MRAWTPLLLATLTACASGRGEPDAGVDGGADAAIDGAIDASTDGVAPANDRCGGAQNLSVAAHSTDGATVNGNLAGYGDDVRPPVACTGFTNDGPDAIYEVTLGPGETITATLTPLGWDGALELVQPCVLMPVCLGGSDGQNPEVVSYTATAAITLYVVVDSFDPSAFGAFTLHVRAQ